MTSASKDANQDLLTTVNAYTSVTSASKDANQDLLTTVNAYTSVTSASTAVLRVAASMVSFLI